MDELLRTSLFQNQEAELVNAFLNDDESRFLMAPLESISSIPQSIPLDDSSINRLISNLYNAPTIEHIETSHSRNSILERGNMSKGDNKYTLKIRSYGNVMADDGYKWRKYGQKSIKNSPNPRSYYKCTNPRCSAKKQVERSTHEPDILLITYEGLHLHYTYPFFHSDPPVKKPKRSHNEVQAHQAQELQEEQQISQPNKNNLGRSFVDYNHKDLGPNEVMGPQGLLEDIVPLIIRKPILEKDENSFSNSSSSSSYPSPPTSPLSFSWYHHYSPLCFD